VREEKYKRGPGTAVGRPIPWPIGEGRWLRRAGATASAWSIRVGQQGLYLEPLRVQVKGKAALQGIGDHPIVGPLAIEDQVPDRPSTTSESFLKLMGSKLCLPMIHHPKSSQAVR
jgi:hypothetical protein